VVIDLLVREGVNSFLGPESQTYFDKKDVSYSSSKYLKKGSKFHNANFWAKRIQCERDTLWQG